MNCLEALDDIFSASWLQTDKSLMSMSGQVLMTCDLARRYGLKDVGGTVTNVYAEAIVFQL